MHYPAAHVYRRERAYLEAVLTQDLLIVVSTVLAAAIRVMDAAFWWCLEGYGHL